MPDDIIEIDVGGTHTITSSKKTLMKFEGSVLEAMFSGRHTLTKHNGKIFIDRDGQTFLHVVNYLRTGMKPPFKIGADRVLVYFMGREVSEEERMFYRELDFWQLPKPENYMTQGNDDQLISE